MSGKLNYKTGLVDQVQCYSPGSVPYINQYRVDPINRRFLQFNHAGELLFIVCDSITFWILKMLHSSPCYIIYINIFSCYYWKGNSKVCFTFIDILILIIQFCRASVYVDKLFPAYLFVFMCYFIKLWLLISRLTIQHSYHNILTHFLQSMASPSVFHMFNHILWVFFCIMLIWK